MRILITGATGFLGSRVVEAFAEKAEIQSIIATGRTLRPDKSVEHPKVEYVLGDLTDKMFVGKLFLNHVDVVINCASLSAPWGSYATFYKANIQTQTFLIESSQTHKVKHFIYISSPSIYFDFKDSIRIKESDFLPAKAVNNYAKTKIEAETLLRDSGIPFVILRPRALVGRGDTVIMPRLIRSYKEGKLRIMGDGTNMVDLTPVSNMVEAMWLSVIADETAINTDYNISNGEPVNLWESINYVLNLINFESVRHSIPAWLLYGIAFFMEKKAQLTFSKKEPVLTRYSVGVLANSFTFDISKAKKQLGYQPKQSTKEAIEEFATWYKKTEA